MPVATRTKKPKQTRMKPEVIPAQSHEIDVHAAVRSFALSSLDDKIFLDYNHFVTVPAYTNDAHQQRLDWLKICETISFQKSWSDEGRPQLVSRNGKEFPGGDHIHAVEQVAQELGQSAESIHWQVEAFKGRNKAIAGRKILKSIQDHDYHTLALLLTIDNRYMHADRDQEHGVAYTFNMPVCGAINDLVSTYFAMIVEKQDCVEYVAADAKGQEGRIHLSTPFFGQWD